MKVVPLFVLLATTLIGSMAANAASLNFSDGNFGSVTQTTLSSSGVPPTLTVPCTSCGNGGGAGIQFVPGSSTGTIVDFLGEPTWTINPTTAGTVSSISGSIDRQANFSGITNENILRLAIEQNGDVYFTSIDLGAATSGVYTTLLSGSLTSASFGLFQGSGNPDFASNPNFAETFELGYVFIASSPGNGLTSVNFDNLAFNVTTTPLPAALPLFAGGLGFVGYLTRRRKRSSCQSLVAA